MKRDDPVHEVQSAPATRLILVLGAIMALGPLSIDMYLPSLPALALVFDASEAQVRFTLGIYLAGLAVGQLVYGPITDRYGRRGSLLFGLALYVIASFGCALATSIESLIVLRLLQACGGCAGMVVVRAVVRDLFDARQAARTFSMLMLVMGAAPILAPMLGGQVLIWLDWRWIFGMLAVFGAGCFLAVLFWLPETLSPETARFNRALPWRAVLGDFRGIMRNRAFVAYGLTGGCSFAAMFAYISGSPFVLMNLYGVAVEHFGLYFGANALSFIVCSQINARLLRVHSPRRLLDFGVGLFIVGTTALMIVVWVGSESLLPLMATLTVSLGALGFIAANTTALALSTFSREAGAASAMLGTMQLGVGAIAATLVGLLHDGTAVPLGMVILGGALTAGIALKSVPAGQ
jgi:DHA1 family bicyclomycin/chloramphenicol resistance-like MFS transporter